MTDYILTMLDSTGIQEYIFGSNRLQENIGASELVYRATTFWVFEALKKDGLSHNVEAFDSTRGTWTFDERKIEADNLDAEVVYAGGGNSMLIFTRKDIARQFTRTLTRRVLEDAPGLTVVAQHLMFDWNQPGALRKARKELGQQLAKHKQSRPLSSPLLGLGVTAVCQSTGLVAIQNSVKLKLSEAEETRLVSQEVVKKLGGRDQAQDRLKSMFDAELTNRYEDRFRFPADIDKLGRIMGEESYVAVIHADGNKMGNHVKQIDIEGKLPNRDYLQELRRFSNNVNKASLAALRTVVAKLVQNTEWNQERKQYEVAGKIPLEQNFLPFRPLVFGGDDVTFIVNGQLGLTLATAYLEAFEDETRKREYNLPGMYASAGIAIVKMHYPFARAYDLSEQLAKSAKKFVRDAPQEDFSALDWHFALSGLGGSIGEIRQREYAVSVGSLVMRPMRLKAEENVQDGRYWQNGIERIIRELDDEGKYARNKVKGLRRPLREGAAATKTYRDNFAIKPLPELLPGNKNHVETGWDGQRCLYFDAIELMDHYIPLS